MEGDEVEVAEGKMACLEDDCPYLPVLLRRERSVSHGGKVMVVEKRIGGEHTRTMRVERRLEQMRA